MDKMLEEYARVNLDSRNHLPFRASTIPFEILIKVTLHTLRDDPYSVKQLMVDLPYSTMGIRNHLRTLIAHGWLILSPGTEDRRCKNLTASPQAIQALRALLLKERSPLPPEHWACGLLALIPNLEGL
jgi:DNA-binding MarR family transcriptional regulator